MLLINGRGVLGAALIAVLLAVLVAGCGSSSDAAPLKKPQFVKQANAICNEAQQERAAVGKELSKGGGSGGSAEAEEVMAEILEPIEGMTAKLSELSPPEGQEKEVEAIVAAFEKGTSQLQGGPEGKGAVTAYDEADRLALAYGLTECTI